MVVDRAQSQLDAQLAGDDAVDLKALGVLGADAAAIGVLVAAHTALNSLWWIPMTALAVAAILLLVVVWPVRLEQGPRWDVFYETFGNAEPIDVGRQMLSDLTEATALNATRMRRTGLVYKAGFVVLLLGLVGCAVAGMTR